MEEKKNTFTIVNDEGKELECDVLFTFDSDETKKSYIVYTDNTTDESGSTRVYASIYDATGADKSLKPIESEQEIYCHLFKKKLIVKRVKIIR